LRVKVQLHGSLKAIHPDPIYVNVDTAAEAVEAVTRQLEGFKPDANGRKRIRVVGFHTIEDLYADLKTEVLDIVPQLNGGKQGGFVQILLGAALVAASFFVPGIWSSFLLSLGASMALGGIASLLAPAPEADKNKNIENRYLGAPGNTTKIGTRIPIVYGMDRVYGHYLSFDISALNYGDEEDEDE
jgi:predicted phage tail protein